MPFGTFGDYFSAEGKMRKTHGNREKKRRIHDDRVKVNDRKNPSKSKEESNTNKVLLLEKNQLLN